MRAFQSSFSVDARRRRRKKRKYTKITRSSLTFKKPRRVNGVDVCPRRQARPGQARGRAELAQDDLGLRVARAPRRDRRRLRRGVEGAFFVVKRAARARGGASAAASAAPAALWRRRCLRLPGLPVHKHQRHAVDPRLGAVQVHGPVGPVPGHRDLRRDTVVVVPPAQGVEPRAKLTVVDGPPCLAGERVLDDFRRQGVGTGHDDGAQRRVRLQRHRQPDAVARVVPHGRGRGEEARVEHPAHVL